MCRLKMRLKFTEFTTTDVVKPGVVTEIKATPVDEDSAKLTWTAPADTDVASYNIYQNGVKIGDSKNTEFYNG